MKENHKYTIDVSESCVEITGTLTIREAFDFLSFFEREGYTTLEEWGDGTTLYMVKRDLERERQDEIIKNSVEELEEYKKRYLDGFKENKKLEEEIADLKLTIQQFMKQELEKRKQILEQKEKLYKKIGLKNLEESPAAKEIVEKYFTPKNEENNGD